MSSTLLHYESKSESLFSVAVSFESSLWQGCATFTPPWRILRGDASLRPLRKDLVPDFYGQDEL